MEDVETNWKAGFTSAYMCVGLKTDKLTLQYALAKLGDACEDGLAECEEGVEDIEDGVKDRGEDGHDGLHKSA